MTTREQAWRVVHATHELGDGPTCAVCGGATLWCWTCMTCDGASHRPPCADAEEED